MNNGGTKNNTYTMILELPVKEASSKRNFFLLNNERSIEVNTLIIFPPVRFNMDNDAVK